ncbi:MAG: amidohydrolase family protein, partial [Streptosporangiaceae bacterium]
MEVLIEHLDFALTVDAADTVLTDASLLVRDGRIADIGPSAAVRQRLAGKPERVLSGRGQGVIPGLIDAHVHLSETLSRAVFPDVLGTRAWVFHWAKPFYAHVDDEDERVSVLLGTAEMLRSGTTCFLDMGAQNDAGLPARAAASVGMR